MFKSIGLGIACLTLTISGVTRATAINVDCGKYGDDKCIKLPVECKLPIECKLPTDCKPEIKCIDFLPVCDVKSDGKDCNKDNNNYGNKDCHIVIPTCLDDKGPKDPCDLKLKPIVDCDDHKIDCNDNKDGHCKDTCKLDFCDKHEPVLCDIGNNNCGKDHNDCNLVIDCNHGPSSYCEIGSCDQHGMCVVPPCDPTPAAVPAPASAAFGGLGVVGIMLMAGLRSRRSAAV